MRQSKRARPMLVPHYCKGCGRCIEACAKHCIRMDTEIDPATGLIPVVLDLEHCSGCALCFDACPEPYGLWPVPMSDAPPERTAAASPAAGAPRRSSPGRVPGAARRRSLPELPPQLLKGTYASAIGALLAGCRHFFGYPITPSTEGAELMAKLLPRLDGIFVQAVSEVATVNMMYGCGGAGLPSMTFTSSPGFSLMLEGISYMVGAEVPAVFVDVMRGGPGLGNIAPEQADISLACRGLGHGNTNAIVLAPTTPQEMLDLTMGAFELAFRYRNPVVILADGYLGQMTGRVRLPTEMIEPGLPAWAVSGDAPHRGNLICSIMLDERDLERHNIQLNEKYARIAEAEQRAELLRCEDADVLLVACNTPARMANGAVEALRQRGLRAGLFRPVTLWPFPVRELARLLPGVSRIVVVEASPGQLENELRLATSLAGISALPPIDHVQHFGGVLPQQDEIVARVLEREPRRAMEVTA